jgi:uncharacterized protein (TIGR03118 family)
MTIVSGSHANVRLRFIPKDPNLIQAWDTIRSNEGITIMALIGAGRPTVIPSTYLVTPLTADTVGFGATIIDINLKNPWGLTSAPGGPLIVADNHASMTTFHDTTGKELFAVTIPSDTSSQGAPSGIAYNDNTNSFIIAGRGPSEYIYAGEDGVISAWSAAAMEISIASRQRGTAIYKGVAIGTTGTTQTLFTANFLSGKVDLFNQNFALTMSTADPNLPAGFAPFNVAVINNLLYVAYAKQKGNGDDLPGAGNGYIAIFGLDGLYQKDLIAQGQLNSPWGMAIAPPGFGDQSGKLLVGNFGDGKINVYDPSSGSYIGQLKDASGNIIAIEGLWSLHVNKSTLYYTAGPGHEAHGVLGKITPE